MSHLEVSNPIWFTVKGHHYYSILEQYFSEFFFSFWCFVLSQCPALQPWLLQTLGNFPASASQILRLEARTTTPSSSGGSFPTQNLRVYTSCGGTHKVDKEVTHFLTIWTVRTSETGDLVCLSCWSFSEGNTLQRVIWTMISGNFSKLCLYAVATISSIVKDLGRARVLAFWGKVLIFCNYRT